MNVPRARRFPYRPIRRGDVQTFTSGAAGWSKPTGTPATSTITMSAGGAGGAGASYGAGGAGGAGIVMVRYLACPACGRSS